MNGNQILKLGGGIVRTSARVAGQVGRTVAGTAFGLVKSVRPSRSTPKPDMDDVTLAHKVESEIFRDSDGLKAAVNVNAVDGVVWLRGEVKHPDQVRALEAAARQVPEVKGVENLLHLPKTPAPTRADTPPRQQRTRSTTRRPTPRVRTGGRVTDDRTDAIVDAEPSPTDHAREHTGRSPAPFGSSGAEDEPSSGGENESASGLSGGEDERSSGLSGAGDESASGPDTAP